MTVSHKHCAKLCVLCPPLLTQQRHNIHTLVPEGESQRTLSILLGGVSFNFQFLLTIFSSLLKVYADGTQMPSVKVKVSLYHGLPSSFYCSSLDKWVCCT